MGIMDEIKIAEKKEPKPLYLVLERMYFNQILEGTKDVEYRFDKPFYRSRLMHDGEYRNFDSVIFKEGYHKNSRRMTIDIEKIILFNDVFEIHLGQITDKNF